MNWLNELLSNQLLITAVASWAVAQTAKLILDGILHKRLNWERLFGDGGMPSGHSATVCSLAMMSGLSYGFDSFAFAVSAVFAIVVCHDAMGVRHETGKQAILINEIVRSFEILTGEELPEVKLKEFVGHTPIQVLAGSLLGLINAAFLYYFVF